MRAYFFLLIFSVLLFVPGIGQLPVVERDEAHFAQASRQMIQTGQYFQVRFQSVTRFQKPPGINWLQVGSVRLLSDADAPCIWPYRLPSALAAVLSVLMTFYFARRLLNRRVAWLAASLLASSLLLVFEAHLAVIDASLLLSVVLMQGALWIIFSAQQQQQSVSPGWAWLFWLAMTSGFVLKGVTPLVGVLTIIVLCWSIRRIDWLNELRWQQGGALFLMLTLFWLGLLNSAEQTNYLWQMLHRDLLPKLASGHESHGKPPLFHLLLLPVTFWPASLFLWQALSYAWSHRDNHSVQFLWAWLIPNWIFFELMPTKLPHYILPMFPALAILAALALEKATPPAKSLRFLQGLWVILSLGIAISIVLLTNQLLGYLTLTAVLAASVIATMSFVCVYWAWQGRYYYATMGVCWMALMAYPLLFVGVFPSLTPLWLAKTVAERLYSSNLSAQHPLYVAGFREPGLVFYLNTHQVVFVNGEGAAIKQCFNARGYLLIDASKQALLAQQPIQLMSSVDGYNYSKGRWEHLLLLSC